MLELWGLGDLALAMPFLREASLRTRVTLLAKAHAGPLLARFAPGVELVPLTAPWTAFRGKYRFLRWPWRELRRTLHVLRAQHHGVGVSARRDPRDHLLLALAGVRRRIGFPRIGTSRLLTSPLPAPGHPHRADYWRALATALGHQLPAITPSPRPGRRIVIHVGAGHPVRLWPAERFAELAALLRGAGWEVAVVSDAGSDLDTLLDTLTGADRFIGNDSGPGHLAALLGVPTFTIFGPQLPELFSPQHPQASWIEGTPCPHRPCFDACRFAVPHCIRNISVDDVWGKLRGWLDKEETLA